MNTREPLLEGADLITAMRALTAQASELSGEIQETLEELEEFQHDVVGFRQTLDRFTQERRKQSIPWPPDEERRR